MKQSEQQREEQLSALLDNALDKHQLQSFMQDLKRDPIADAETAQRYRLVGDVMRDELDQTSFMDISSAVHRAIEKEPELQFEHDGASARVKHKSSADITGIFTQWLQRLIRPLSGVAVAASVATVTLLTFNSVQNTSSNDPALQLAQVPAMQQQIQQQAVSSQLAQAPLERVNPDVARNIRVASTIEGVKKTPEQQQQLIIFMQQHSGYARQSTLQGMMPYVRAAGVNTQQKD